MILPYVYRLTHKETGQFYIGFRKANKVRSEFDIGFYYFSSSPGVKSIGFNNFIVEIIAEFFNWQDALEFEQNLIKEHFRNPLNLNRNYNINGTNKFLNIKPSESTKLKQSITMKGRYSGNNNPMYGKPVTYETRRNSALKQSSLSKMDKLYIITMYTLGANRNEIASIYKHKCSLRTIDRTINRFKNKTIYL